MATAVYDIVELQLLDPTGGNDGRVITCRPLKIKLLREFMKEFAKMDAEGVRQDNDKALTVLLKCGFIAMKQYAPEITLVDMEDLFDIQTLYKVIEVASGIKLGGDEGNGQATAEALGLI